MKKILSSNTSIACLRFQNVICLDISFTAQFILSSAKAQKTCSINRNIFSEIKLPVLYTEWKCTNPQPTVLRWSGQGSLALLRPVYTACLAFKLKSCFYLLASLFLSSWLLPQLKSSQCLSSKLSSWDLKAEREGKTYTGWCLLLDDLEVEDFKKETWRRGNAKMSWVTRERRIFVSQVRLPQPRPISLTDVLSFPYWLKPFEVDRSE